MIEGLKINPEHKYLLDLANWRKDSKGYAFSKINGKHTLLHKVLLWCPKGYEVDHINGDVLDNRLENLRIVTRQQNACNRGILSNNKCGYKGVIRSKNRKRFVAQIYLQGKQYHIGTYDTAEEAHEAYKKKAIELHGEYARFE